MKVARRKHDEHARICQKIFALCLQPKIEACPDFLENFLSKLVPSLHPCAVLTLQRKIRLAFIISDVKSNSMCGKAPDSHA